MKIALCISGQMRTCKSTFPTVFRTLIAKYNPDIFIHTWNIVGISNKECEKLSDSVVPKGLLLQYKPKKYIVEEFNSDYIDKLAGIEVPDVLKKYAPVKSPKSAGPSPSSSTSSLSIIALVLR